MPETELGPESGSEDISGLLIAWSQGDEQALSGLMPLVYPELRRIARQHLARRVRNLSLESAAIANEAYVRLVLAKGIQCHNRAHFFALCAQMCRRILVDHARHRLYAKRGGGAAEIPLEEGFVAAPSRGVSVLALDDALATLSRIDPRKGKVVELRYFGGLSVEESAEVLGVAPETVMRDWKMAKSWLYRALTSRRSGARESAPLR